jgi:hypothetical protein
MTMDERTLTALRGSIAKWEGIVAGTAKNEGAGNCPLCQLFLVPAPLGSECVGCPVRDRSGASNCFNTPYMNFVWTWPLYSEKKHEHAKRELEFLTSLLPEDHPSEEYEQPGGGPP